MGGTSHPTRCAERGDRASLRPSARSSQVPPKGVELVAGFLQVRIGTGRGIDALLGPHRAEAVAELPVRPLKDTDSLLSALNESVASPNGLIARVDADGVLTGVSSRDDIHEHAGQAHTEARVAA